ncbi:hypothetical protein [Mycoplasma sp. P36-A1]|uniref:hypothetical protein n=1 Tax=Mycoplasma sp. P36-A1 TaxID=3252900 RepID=UPI003C2B9A11
MKKLFLTIMLTLSLTFITKDLPLNNTISANSYSNIEEQNIPSAIIKTDDTKITTADILEQDVSFEHYELLAIPFSAMAFLLSVLYLKRMQKNSKEENK